MWQLLFPLALGLGISAAAASQEVAPQPIPVVVRESLSQHLAANRIIEQSLPVHPLSAQLFEEVMALGLREMPSERGMLQRALVLTYGDRAFGLYALDAYLRDTPAGENPAAFCEWLCRAHPEFRTSARALDYLLEQSSKAEATCEAWATEAGASRLGIFARMRRAGYETTRDPLLATQWLLSAWALEPAAPLNTIIAERTQDIFREHKQHLFGAPFSAHTLGVPVPPPIVRRVQRTLETLVSTEHPQQMVFLKALWQARANGGDELRDMLAITDAPPNWRLPMLFTLATIEREQELALTYMEEALTLAEPTDPDGMRAAEIGVAGFLFGPPVLQPGDKPATPEEATARMALIGRMNTLRGLFLERQQKSSQELSGDERAYYAMLIARRQILGFQSAQASATLDAADALPLVSAPYREALATLRAHMDDPGFFAAAGSAP